VLRRRELELTLVERKPEEPAAFAALSPAEPEGAGLAVFAPQLSAPELALIELMLGEAALDVALALRERKPPPDVDPAAAPEARTDYHGIIGTATAMQELYSLLDRIAPSDATVLIQGENGTGKELVARAIHVGSERRDRKFVVTNCSAFNDNLLDSELFGHKRGSFTGAIVDKPGLFEIADAGTFFLDEIGDMSPTLQVKVLRVLQEGTFNRVGDTDMRKVDVRIIAATNRDLAAMVAAGRFREDLYYRIHVLSVMLPALRERREDVPVLIDHFLARHHRSGPSGSRPSAPRACSCIRGPATCASSRTRSSASSCWRVSPSRSAPSCCRRGSGNGRPPPRSRARST
jgi:DNA-binding NtrC family response regulator